MKSSFRSLISQLSSPIFKEGSECRETFWPDPSDFKWCLNFPSQGQLSPLYSFPWSLEKKKAEETSVMVNFWPTTRSRHVSLAIQSLSKTPTRNAIQATPRRASSSYSWDCFLLLRNRLSWGYSFFLEYCRLRPVLPFWVRRSLQPISLISSYICAVLYAIISFHISHVTKESYSSVDCYGK